MKPDQEFCEHDWIEKLSPAGAIDRCSKCEAFRWHSTGEPATKKEANDDSSMALQLKLVEQADFISAQRMAISHLLNILHELHEHLNDGEVDEAIAKIEANLAMGQGSQH